MKPFFFLAKSAHDRAIFIAKRRPMCPTIHLPLEDGPMEPFAQAPLIGTSSTEVSFAQKKSTELSEPCYFLMIA